MIPEGEDAQLTASSEWPLTGSAATAPRWPILVGGVAPCAFFQCVFQSAGPAALDQQVGEGFVGKRLQVFSAVTGKQIERQPGLRVQADQFAFGCYGHAPQIEVAAPGSVG